LHVAATAATALSFWMPAVHAADGSDVGGKRVKKRGSRILHDGSTSTKKSKSQTPPTSPPPPLEKLQIGVKKRPENCALKSIIGDLVAVHYTGVTFEDTPVEFGSSIGKEPTKFYLGYGEVISGWDRGLLGMCLGEIRKLVVPSDLAYGERGYPPNIKPNMGVAFEVELVGVTRDGMDFEPVEKKTEL